MQFSFGIIDQTSPSTPSATPTPVWKILDSPLVVTWIYEFSILFAHFAMIIYSSIFHSFRKIAALYFSLSGFDWLIKPNLFYHGRSLIYWWLAESPIWFTGLAYITKQVFTHKLPYRQIAYRQILHNWWRCSCERYVLIFHYHWWRTYSMQNQPLDVSIQYRSLVELTKRPNHIVSEMEAQIQLLTPLSQSWVRLSTDSI